MGDEEIRGGGSDHERQEAPIPPGIKEIARHQQKNVLRAMAEAPIRQHDGDQEDKVNWRVKKHADESNELP